MKNIVTIALALGIASAANAGSVVDTVLSAINSATDTVLAASGTVTGAVVGASNTITEKFKDEAYKAGAQDFRAWYGSDSEIIPSQVAQLMSLKAQEMQQVGANLDQVTIAELADQVALELNKRNL